ncbi:MAG: hypothetical protein J07HB67_01576, partial [halophilic archaeon J07HB67]
MNRRVSAVYAAGVVRVAAPPITAGRVAICPTAAVTTNPAPTERPTAT